MGIIFIFIKLIRIRVIGYLTNILMKHRLIFPIVLFFLSTDSGYGQVNKRKNYFPIWTFSKDSINIHGMSVGLWTLNEKPRFTNTNGFRIELVGIGLALMFVPHSPVEESDSSFIELKKQPISEKINGFNVSALGSACHCLTNGITIGSIAQLNFQVNGVSISGMSNFNQKHNGLMIAAMNDAYDINGLQIGYFNNGFKTKGIQIGLFNESNKLRGIQIGLFNRSNNLKGIQIGLWNVNAKRKLPLINWSF
jgi:hypothetical protein